MIEKIDVKEIQFRRMFISNFKIHKQEFKIKYQQLHNKDKYKIILIHYKDQYLKHLKIEMKISEFLM